MLNKNDHSVDKRVRRFTFKPRLIWITLLIVSTMKKVEEAAMLPTNLHINDIVIQRRNVMSCDSLNSLFRKSLSYLSFKNHFFLLEYLLILCCPVELQMLTSINFIVEGYSLLFTIWMNRIRNDIFVPNQDYVPPYRFENDLMLLLLKLSRFLLLHLSMM